MKDFFSKEVQDEMKSEDYINADCVNSSESVIYDMESFYFKIDNKKRDYKSYYFKIKGKPFSSNLTWVFPKSKKELTVTIRLNRLTNNKIIENTETGFVIVQPQNTKLAFLELDKHEKGISIPKKWFKKENKLDFDKELSLKYTKTKKIRNLQKSNIFVMQPRRCMADTGEKDWNSWARDDLSATGWTAMSIDVINDYTIRVFLTDALYPINIDFHNLVLDIEFSETLANCEVGFYEMSGYFGDIAAGLTHEEIIKKHFGSKKK